MACEGRPWDDVGGPQVVVALLLRPWLWRTALIQLFRLAPSRWWARPPRRPAPDPAYLRFRATTAYGDPARRPEPADVVTWLTWCRAWPSATKVQSLVVPRD